MSIILQKLVLKNFKCYENHVIPFRSTTIMMGKNNAGKSTVVEALRILGLACARIKNAASYVTRPEWLSDFYGIVTKGINITSNAIDVELEQVFNRYGQPPAIIEAEFSNGMIIKIYIRNEKEIFTVLFHDDKNLKVKTAIHELGVPEFCVLPQITPLRKEEDYVSWSTIRRNRFSKRSSGNFRNHLYECKDDAEYRIFEELLSETWPGVMVHSITKEDDGRISLNLRDRDFVTEIYHMGHGVQMWIQTIWFIANADEDAILILDEPDVYMHADLQRKLIRLIKNKYAQVVVATHSVEIISDVQPKDLLLINRSSEQSYFAENHPMLQEAVYDIGSIHNISLNRILNNKTYLFVEGEDKALLQIFFDILFPDNPEPLDYYTSVSTGGFASWETQKERAGNLKKASPDIRIFFLYDRDFFPDEIINERLEDARKHHINMHIWERKEIENYLLNPTVIARYVAKKKREREAVEVDIKRVKKEIEERLEELCEEQKLNVFLAQIDQLHKLKAWKGQELSTLYKRLEPEFEKRWQKPEYRISVVPGKEIFARICEYCHQKFRVSIGKKQVAGEFEALDIPEEIKRFLGEIGDVE